MEEDSTAEEEELSDDDLLESEELGLEGADLETQIEQAVTELSEEELESEVDEDMLLDIVTSSADSLDALSSRDLKMAFGEELEEEPEVEEIEEKSAESVDSEEMEDETSIDEVVDDAVEENSGVEALKNLLSALTDKKVAASMKGMKISINITLGDN